jgi:hypothetical protein
MKEPPFREVVRRSNPAIVCFRLADFKLICKRSVTGME